MGFVAIVEAVVGQYKVKVGSSTNFHSHMCLFMDFHYWLIPHYSYNKCCLRIQKL